MAAALDHRMSLASIAGGLLGAVFLSLTPAGISGGYALGAAIAARRIWPTTAVGGN